MFSISTLRLPALVTAALLFCAHGVASAAEDEGIVTDRPDFVESSKVVGLGHFQIETSVLAERARSEAMRIRTLSTPTLLRYGVSDTVELRLETDGRIVERTSAPGATRSTAAGYADTALGVKWHVLDEAAGMPSVGVLLHADLASGSNGFKGEGVRPSLRAALEWDLAHDFSLGLMPGVGVERNDAGARYRYGILGLVLGKELTPQTRAFVELAAPKIARAVDGGTVSSFDTGAAWLLSPRCQLDFMVSFGLNRRTPDVAVTAGVSFKL